MVKSPLNPQTNHQATGGVQPLAPINLAMAHVRFCQSLPIGCVTKKTCVLPNVQLIFASIPFSYSPYTVITGLFHDIYSLSYRSYIAPFILKGSSISAALLRQRPRKGNLHTSLCPATLQWKSCNNRCDWAMLSHPSMKVSWYYQIVIIQGKMGKWYSTCHFRDY